MGLKIKINQQGSVHTIPLLFIIAVVGLISFMLVSSTMPLKGGLLAQLFNRSSLFASTDTTIDGSQKDQVMDGFGVNAIPKTWQGGTLKPGIDLLIDQGSTMWRVDVGNGHSTWEATNDDSDPNNFNWAYYNTIYSNPQFSDLWAELQYLNSKGITNPELSMSGLVPNWMSSAGDGHSIKSGMEDEFVEEVTSMLYYARNVAGVQFHRVSPLNETDQGSGSPEGPYISSSAQFTSILHKLAVKLDALGMSDVKIVAPHPVGNIDYVNGILSDPVIMAHLDALAFHDYVGSSLGGNLQQVKFSNYPNTHVWVGEWNNAVTDGWLDDGHQPANEWVFARAMTDYLLNFIDDGENAMLAWDAWDNWHEHNPCCAIDHWGMIYQDASTGAYLTKPRYYTNETVFKYVLPGMTKVAATTTNNNVRIFAFTNSNGQLTIVGHNKATSAQTINVTLNNVPAVSSLSFYQTTQTKNFQEDADVPVSGNSFSVTLDPDSFYTLTNAGGPAPTPTPTPSPIACTVDTDCPTGQICDPNGSGFCVPGPTPTPSPTPVPTPTPTPTPTPVPTPSPTPKPSGDITPPTVSVTAPTNGATVSGTAVALKANASDNVKVAGVQFQVDGVNVGAEDTTSPYSVNWDSTTVANGSHSVTAIARDSSNNRTTSNPITVNVSNAVSNTLVGDSKLESTNDFNSAGQAEAFKYTASLTGTANKLSIYMGSSTTASQVLVGLYTNSGSNPGTLLATTTLTNPIKNAWNTVSFPVTSVNSGSVYWIAVLTPVSGGTAYVKDVGTGNASQTSAQTNLTTLPATWSAGANWPTSKMSAYLTP